MKGIIVKLFFAMMLLLSAIHSVAADTLQLRDDQVLRRLYLSPYISIYNGDQKPASISEASLLSESEYVPVGASTALQLMKTSWFRFSIHNPTSTVRTLILDFDQALFSRIEWHSRSGDTVREFITGQSYPYASRDINYNYFAFRLDIQPGETLTADFSIYTPYAAMFLPVLSESQIFFEYIPQDWQLSGAIIGMLYAVALFLFVYVIRLRQLGAAHAMLGQVIASIFSMLYLTGAMQRLLPEMSNVLWRDIAYVLIFSPGCVFYCMAICSFFRTAINFPYIDKVLRFLILLNALMIVLLPVVRLEYLLLVTLAVNTLTILVSALLAIISLSRRQEGTSLYSIGILAFTALAGLTAAAAVGIIPNLFLARNGYALGLTVQADFLFLAVATRIFTVEHEQVRLQTEMLRLDADMKARSEFVDRVTHDIKSPLSAVIGAAQLLREKNSAEDRVNYLGIIQRSCGAVIAIVDDILGHSRMKAGQLSLHKQMFSIAQLLLDIEASIKASQDHKNLSFVMTMRKELPPLVEGDKMRVSQLLINLLTNAFKFTDEGVISLTVDIIDQHPGVVSIRFIIQDTGIGMSEAFLKKAFEPYAREEGHGSYRPGFGLGLSICKQLVELMGGSIDLLSAVGQGSRFTVILPFTLPE